MRIFLIIPIVVLLASCSENERAGDDTVSVEDTIPEVKIILPDHDAYVDELLAPDVLLHFDEGSSSETEVVMATVNGKAYEILKYEGQLVDAFATSDGYNYRLDPYHYYDEALEMEVKSPYTFSINLSVTKTQESQLGFYENSSHTNNIKWDWFENLFEVYFYLDENLNNRPLKMSDLGKTEWDG